MRCKLVSKQFPLDSLISLENVSDIFEHLLGSLVVCHLTGQRMGVSSFLLKVSLAPLQMLLSHPKYRCSLFLGY